MPRSIVPLFVAVLVPLALAAGASGVPCGPTTCAPLSSSVAGAQTLDVRPRGLEGPLVVYDLAASRVAARLPAGVLSANGRHYVTAASSGLRTRVTRYDARTGKRLGSTSVGEAGLAVDAVSSNGRYAALAWGTKSPTIWIFDLDGKRVVRKVRLAGDWAVDALSADGRKLYLIQNHSGGGYDVRVHDASRGLVPGAITDPNEPEKMTGIAWSSTGTTNGRWQLTLYLESANTSTGAFVHALSLNTATARCIDLPGGEFMAVGRYALVLAPNGRTLYAANPSLGLVATIDLQAGKVVDTVRFGATGADDARSSAFGAMSPDGRTLYFSAGRGLLAYDTEGRAVRGPYAPGAVAGVGFHPSGRTVLVVRPSGATLRLDAATGAPLAA
jgi:DNA-binding beta-propeller fold protein YncE